VLRNKQTNTGQNITLPTHGDGNICISVVYMFIGIKNIQGIAWRNDIPSSTAVRWRYLDGAATWQMLLKRCRRRLRCRFGYLWWPHGHTEQWVVSSTGFITPVTIALRCIFFELRTCDKQRQTDGRIDRPTAVLLNVPTVGWLGGT